MATASPAPSFPCTQCSRTFTRSHGLRRHEASVHQQILSYPCPLCDRAFTLKSLLTDHLVTHTSAEPYLCAHCERTFKSRRSRSRHCTQIHSHLTNADVDDTKMTTHETTVAPVQQSSHTRKRARHTTQHIAAAADSTTTSAAAPGAATVGPLTAASIIAAAMTATASVAFPFLPPVPPLTFVGTFICGTCSYSCDSEQLLQLHLTTHKCDAKLAPIAATAISADRPDEERHDAEVDLEHDEDDASATSSIAASPSLPSKKRRRATPAKTHVCPYEDCASSFSYAHVLANHIRARHTGDTPFACGVCDRAFPTLARKVAHEKTHLKL